jgi:hypothetical protein
MTTQLKREIFKKGSRLSCGRLVVQARRRLGSHEQKASRLPGYWRY